MPAHASAFGRGFLIVLLTSTNVAQIAAQHYVGALVVGVAISWVWWGNSHGAAHNATPYVRECYAIGAGCGTLTGMLLIRALYG